MDEMKTIPARKAGRKNHEKPITNRDRWKIVRSTLTEILRDVDATPTDRVGAAQLLRELDN